MSDKTVPTRKGRGRPKGAFSFVTVPMSKLVSTLGPEAQVPVSRVWLERHGGFAGLVAKPADAVPEPIESLMASAKVTLQVHEFPAE